MVDGRAYVLGPDEGEAVWFAGALLVIKAAREQTGGAFSFIDQRVPGSYAVPRHVHHDEDEAWYVLDGDITVYCGDAEFSAGPGSWVFAPKGIAHAFNVGPEGGRLLTMTAPAGFADFVRAAGVPARELAVPPPTEPDVQRLAELGRQHGVEIVGPPPH